MKIGVCESKRSLGKGGGYGRSGYGDGGNGGVERHMEQRRRVQREKGMKR